jgi:hypothetical protein
MHGIDETEDGADAREKRARSGELPTKRAPSAAERRAIAARDANFRNVILNRHVRPGRAHRCDDRYEIEHPLCGAANAAEITR